MVYKILAIIFLMVIFAYKLLLTYLRQLSTQNPIPANVADIYDAETYEKWCAYRSEKNRLTVLESFAGFVVDVVLFTTDAYASFASLFPKGVEIQLFAVLLLSTLTAILTLPFTYYDTMKIEEKYGFNKSSAKTFWADQIKEFIISLGILFLLTWILSLLHRALGDWMIVAFAGVLCVLILIIVFLYPLLSRINNKFTPLEEGELRDKLTALLTKHGYKVRAIEVMDGSRRSTKANAYFAGFGKSKSIVLYDTLIDKLSSDEICAVFAHELGHGVHHDTLTGQIASFGQMIALSVLAWLTLRSESLFAQFGFNSINYGFAVILLLTIEFALLSPLYSLFANALSRRHEYRADRFAVSEGYGEHLISALKKLTQTDFGDVSPVPLSVALEFSHPPLSQRIDAIEKAMEKQE